MKTTKRKPYYSGPKSIKFWERINALPRDKRSAAYSLGVVLQNVEGDVLRLLDMYDRSVEYSKKKSK